ncbi:MAG: hypothetical protein H6696_11615 [Deferribacteres bacterium]|nr:hypothetical protein [candidate division KSB1 bacterium]MCB9502578.1 hypothetical protein [Deferribacteres bacterium]
MRMQKLILVLCGIFAASLIATSEADAQFFEGDGGIPRLMLGGSTGTFRISYEDFKDIYGDRSGNSVGGFASFLISVPYNVIVKYRTFNKSGSYETETATYNLDWEQRFINFGLRYFRPGKKGFSNHFGFGFSIIDIEEKGDYSIFDSQNKAPKSNNAGGFFLDFGIHYGFNRYIDTFAEMEISSAGIEGKSGFEGSSVGGYYFSVGVAVSPF